MKFNSLSYIFLFTIFILVFFLCVFTPSLSEYGTIVSYMPNNYENHKTIDISSSNFTWPTPGYTTITSPFGSRISPITGANSYHYGTDIGAPMGSTIIAIFPGTVTFTGFNGANGYTVTVANGNLSVSYSHVSPNFIVYVGQYITQGQPVAIVGPKNVYNVPNNPYRDSNGNPTNRLYNRAPLTPKHKERRQSRQSYELFLKI